MTAAWPGIEPMSSRSLVQCLTYCAFTPSSSCFDHAKQSLSWLIFCQIIWDEWSSCGWLAKAVDSRFPLTLCC